MQRKVFIILYIMIMTALLVIVYAIPKVTGALTPTTVLKYGTLQITDEVKCYVVRSETVYLAGSSGSLNYYISQDTQVRSGVKTLSIAKSAELEKENPKFAEIASRLGEGAVMTADYAAAFNGCVSYFADGYETFFTPETMEGLSFKDVEDISAEQINLTRGTARKGEPIYKICDNSLWFLTTWVDAGDISKYEVGNNVTICLPKASIAATVYSLENEGDKWQVTFSTNRYYEDFSMMREVDVTVITADYSGIIVPNGCITAEDGMPGVYVKNSTGDYVFKPIKIITSDGEKAIVKVSSFTGDDGKQVSTVEIYDEILKHPN